MNVKKPFSTIKPSFPKHNLPKHNPLGNEFPPGRSFILHLYYRSLSNNMSNKAKHSQIIM